MTKTEAAMRALIPFVAALLAASAAMADTALLIANTRYEAAQNLRHADEIAGLEAPLSAAGFQVVVVENGPVEAMRAAVSALLEAEEDERVVIAIAGHLVRSRDGSWLLGSAAEAPDLGTVGGQGVSLSVLMEIASRASGRAVLLIGHEPRRIVLGAGLASGLGPLDPPQGVSVLSGAPDDLARFAERSLLSPGADMREEVDGARGIRSHGFLSAAIPFLPSGSEGVAVPPLLPSGEEQALWDAVTELNTAGAYRAYLEQYPDGAYRREAESRIAALADAETDPLAEAEATESALGLSRSERQQIQRDLTILDYNTRGIDGIFGQGTRGAIRAWQTTERYEATSFLTRPQITSLRRQAAQRAAELEEEDRRQQEERDRADRAFWQATGQGDTESALRTYLDRYPNGLYAEIARERLDAIETDRRAEAEAEERADWERVRRTDTILAYRRYLDRYPEGLFTEIARARIAEIEGGLPPDVMAEAEAREAALNLNDVTRLLVERRLAAMRYEPGQLDGRFTEQTRAAIRRYQDGRGLPATGYLDQLAVVRLLAEAIGGRILE